MPAFYTVSRCGMVKEFTVPTGIFINTKGGDVWLYTSQEAEHVAYTLVGKVRELISHEKDVKKKRLLCVHIALIKEKRPIEEIAAADMEMAKHFSRQL